MNGLINLEPFRRFYLEYPKRLPWVNSDAVSRKSFRSVISETVSRKFGASVSALEIHHAVRDESWQSSILKTRGAA